MPRKLIIQDVSDYIGRWQVYGEDDHLDVITLRVKSKDDLIGQLNALIKQGMTFDRVVFRTHGDTGQISLGNDYIYSGGWAALANKVNFPALLVGRTKVIFDSCATMDGKDGKWFLWRAGQHMLRGGGGSVSGWTSWGLAIPGWVTRFGGHTLHLPNYNNFKTLHFNPGGVLVSPVPLGPPDGKPTNPNDVWGDKGRYQKPNVGNKI
jgi:hypothetical protein